MKHINSTLSSMSRITGIDFSKFDLDEPLPPTLTTNSHQSTLAKWIGKTPRALARTATASRASTSRARPTMSPG